MKKISASVLALSAAFLAGHAAAAEGWDDSAAQQRFASAAPAKARAQVRAELDAALRTQDTRPSDQVGLTVSEANPHAGLAAQGRSRDEVRAEARAALPRKSASVRFSEGAV